MHCLIDINDSSGIIIMISTLNMIFNVNCYLELRNAISILLNILYFANKCEIGSLDII